MNVNYTLIGKRIHEIRTRKKMTQAKLASLIQVTTPYISCIEHATRHVSLEILILIANALGVTVDELLCGNQLFNPTDYQTDIDALIADCTYWEKRFIYELIAMAKEFLRNNGWRVSKKESSNIHL